MERTPNKEDLNGFDRIWPAIRTGPSPALAVTAAGKNIRDGQRENTPCFHVPPLFCYPFSKGSSSAWGTIFIGPDLGFPNFFRSWNLYVPNISRSTY
jgi:hypothetical protein